VHRSRSGTGAAATARAGGTDSARQQDDGYQNADGQEVSVLKRHYQDLQSDQDEQDGIRDIVDDVPEQSQPVTSDQGDRVPATLVTHDEPRDHHGPRYGNVAMTCQGEAAAGHRE